MCESKTRSSDRGDFGATTGWDPGVYNSNRLHVHILRFSFINLMYILLIPLKWSVIFLQSWTSSAYFSNSTGSFVTNCRFSPNIDWKMSTCSRSDLESLGSWPTHAQKLTSRTLVKALEVKKKFKICFMIYESEPMIGENQQLVTDEPVEFEK